MGVFDKIKNAFGVDDEDYDDDFEYEEEEEVVENTVKPDFSQIKKEKNISLNATAPVSAPAVTAVKQEMNIISAKKILNVFFINYHSSFNIV